MNKMFSVACRYQSLQSVWCEEWRWTRARPAGDGAKGGDARGIAERSRHRRRRCEREPEPKRERERVSRSGHLWELLWRRERHPNVRSRPSSGPKGWGALTLATPLQHSTRCTQTQTQTLRREEEA